MKKTTFFCLSAVLICLAGYAGIRNVPSKAQDVLAMVELQPARKGAEAVKVKKRSKSAVRVAAQNEAAEKVREDFSLFAAGSEAAPDAVDLTAADESGYIADAMTLQPGWSGAAVYQAGGCAYIGMYDYGNGEESGMINTPTVDLSGNDGGFTVRFRARVGGDVKVEQVAVVGVSEALDDFTDYSDVQITDEWKEYEVTLTKGSAAHYIQLYAYEYPLYIDDITVEQVRTGISAPVAVEATDLTETGFTANWNAVAEATSYLLSVYSETKTEGGVEEATVKEGFDGLVVLNKKFIDPENSVFPEGWTLGVTENGTSRNLYPTEGNYSSPSIALAFDATGDFVESPEAPAPISKVAFWTKNQQGDAASFVTVEGFDGTAWQEIGQISPSECDKAGEVVEFPVSLPDISKIKLSYTKSAGNCSIDDVAYTYGGATVERHFLLEDKEVSATSYGVSGIVAGTQYYYYVKAKDAKFVSEASNVIAVGGSAGEEGVLDTPVMKPATDVTDSGFTANWEAVKGAAEYSFYTYLLHTAPEAEKYALLDTDFSAITEGTLEVPEYGDFYYLDEIVGRTDWFVSVPMLANGALGISNMLAAYEMPGMLISPYFDLTGDRVTVEFRALGQNLSAATVGLFYDLPDGTSVEITSKPVSLTSEWADYSVTLEGGNEECYVVIACGDGEGTLFLDNLALTQQLEKGEEVFIPYFYEETAATSIYVATPDRKPGDRFAYQASAYRLNADESGFEAQSEYSDLYFVDSDDAIETLAGDKVRVAVTSDGIEIANPTHADVAVYALSGVCVYLNDGGDGVQRVTLGKGTYVVKVGAKAVKVIR